MTKIFVGNLSYGTTDADLEAAFSAFGAVETATVVKDRDSGRSRGFGFVEMTDADQASQAISGMNGRDLDGRTLNVNESRPREMQGGKYGDSQPQGGYNKQNRW